MGEFVLVDSEEEGSKMEVEKGEERDSGVVRWEEFLPKMMIRVLLVEADDSTRQIIAALLRKCNYKVAAISDGLKAWEILKQRHNNFDLILTEVDLPSISGYALLSLIMDHDGCRNIPVIMMSSSDSISTVFKCMLKGAADFLIKPVRRNELKNLWQHVWRKISQANNGVSVQNLHGGDCKAEASSQNGDTRICSDDNVSSSRHRSQAIENDSNSQGSSQMKHHGASNLSSNEVHHLDKGMKLVVDIEQERATRFESSEGAHGDEAYASTFRLERVGSCSGRMAQYEGIELASCRNMDDMLNGEVSGHTRQAVDLIGTIDNHLECTIDSSTSNCEKHYSSAAPQLELSLRRSNDPDNRRTDKKQKLNHSNASAFSRYSTSKNLRTSFPSIDYAFSSDGENKSTVMGDPTLHIERTSPVPQVGLAPTPGVGTCPGYAPTYPSLSSPQVSQGAIGLKSTVQKELSPFFDQGTNCSGLGHSGFDEISNNEEKLASDDQQKHAAGSASQSANSTLCSGGFVAHLGQGNDNMNQPMARMDNAADEHLREKGSNMLTNEQFTRERSTHHQNPQREAALAKFRQKRKDRCYEKKVRYQSRKRLAEQRPRVKGQFVRQVQTDQPLAYTDSRPEDDEG